MNKGALYKRGPHQSIFITISVPRCSGVSKKIASTALIFNITAFIACWGCTINLPSYYPKVKM